MAVAHDFRSSTANLRHAFIEDKAGISPRLMGRRIVIVDTPGFGDPYTEDVEILRRIAVWLASS